MKQRNQTFIAFEKKFNALGRRWAAWMSKKETGISPKRKKMYLRVLNFFINGPDYETTYF